MTEEDLEPFVRDLLQEAVDKRDLDMDVAEKLVARAKRLEGDELEDAVRTILGRA